jgi:hypothetical protein
MIARFAIAAAMSFAAFPAKAEPMNADAARRFVVGKLFAFTCFDGSRGSGRIYGDGSVIGSVQFAGSGPMRNLWLPAGTVHVKGQTVCATVKGMLFEPCFNLDKTASESFRGSIAGMTFAYCDFTRSDAVVASLKPQSRAPQALNAPVRAQGE